ncbi:hypothetical protein E5Q_06733 [Mixia osmundae IAM 14324]|uniref:Uncharacterized protein n=1 Tax=Mixia osmundae (strain CBS 9802 / IAM 14324 / JCM 22182 / KY 12970) TaxID=764103 RepID=G7EB20_MIXOS|nr:hypothetical protein E5Q_06733 [Mixia osmundae IAM 14324]
MMTDDELYGDRSTAELMGTLQGGERKLSWGVGWRCNVDG